MRRVVVVLVVVALIGSLVYWGHSSYTASTSKVTEPEATGSMEGSSSARNSQVADIPTPSVPRGNPTDYFPFTPGLRLEYRITLGTTDPLNFEITEWPMGNGGVRSETRGRLFPRVPQKEYFLILQIEGPAAEQGPYQWDGVKVRVIKDDLDIYRDVKDLFWARTRGGDLSVIEVRMYSPNTPGAPMGPWGVPESSGGNSSRIVFFGGSPGVTRNLGSSEDKSGNPFETLAFFGSDDDALHFVRLVRPREGDASDPDTSELDRGFVEQTWFKQGKGLVRLEQRVGGVVTMTWELVGEDSAPGFVVQ